MSVRTTILALVLFPLLNVLPLNLVRFQWGFRQGLAPMPPEVQERAEAADRAVLLVIYVTLLTVGAILLHGSAISVYTVGLTANNWKSAIALGVLISYVPLGVGAVLQRILPPDELRKDPEARGPLATWCGLGALGSFSIEFWRALCIAALIRLDLSASIAVLIAAVAYGAPQLTSSTPRAAGTAVAGGVAGFLFVKTGSLLAPLTMSLIIAGAHLYRVRHIPSRAPINLAPLKYAIYSQTINRAQNLSRYVTCPVCSASFHPGKVKRTLGTFTCPECGEVLEYETRGFFDYFLFVLCLYGVPIVLYYIGYRDLTLILVSIGAASLIFFFGIAIHGLLIPPMAQRKLTYGDSGLHLSYKSHRQEDNRRKDDKNS